MFKYSFVVLGTIILSSLFTNCSTDVDLNAPYKAVPIVFGMVDQSVDTQYIKINKSFAGSGNNVTYASINDSVLFNNLSANVEVLFNGNIEQTYPLQEKWVKNIDSGIFYGDSQKVYYYVPTGGILATRSYRLVGSANEGAIEFEATAKPVGKVTFTSQFKNNVTPIVPVVNNSNSGIKFATANSSINNQYLNVSPIWSTVENGKRYELELHFYYFEHTNSTVERKEIVWKFGKQTTVTTSGGSSMSQEISGAGFYQMLQSRLSNNPNEANIIKRVPDRFEFVVTVADEDLNTYIEVNQPSLGIVTERPSFSNIEGGLGIFAARNTENFNQGGLGQKLMLNKTSLEELIIGQYTSGFKFCSDEPYHTSTPFACQ
jgi:hypothetical protein